MVFGHSLQYVQKGKSVRFNNEKTETLFRLISEFKIAPLAGEVIEPGGGGILRGKDGHPGVRMGEMGLREW